MRYSKIITPDPSVWGKTPENDEIMVVERKRKRDIETAIKQPDHILIAWALCKYGLKPTISAWYLPEDGKRWIYRREYDEKTLKECGSPSRRSCLGMYHWFKEERRGKLFIESHICAPLYILLDNKELRSEYLAGNLGVG